MRRSEFDRYGRNNKNIMIAFGMPVLVSLVVARKNRKVDMAEMLKGWDKLKVHFRPALQEKRGI